MTASEEIDKQIAGLADWRGKMIAKIRKLILATDADIVEEWKWGTGVWNKNGMICAVGAFNDHVKINFFKGAKLQDPQKLFNAGLEAKTSRSIDLYEADIINEKALQELIHSAIAQNTVKGKK